MAFEPPYIQQTNFSAQVNPVPNPSAVDVELFEIARVLNNVRANLRLIQRDDGSLGNEVVTPESLAPTTIDFIVGRLNAALALLTPTLAANIELLADDETLAAIALLAPIAAELDALADSLVNGRVPTTIQVEFENQIVTSAASVVSFFGEGFDVREITPNKVQITLASILGDATGLSVRVTENAVAGDAPVFVVPAAGGLQAKDVRVNVNGVLQVPTSYTVATVGNDLRVTVLTARDGDAVDVLAGGNSAANGGTSVGGTVVYYRASPPAFGDGTPSGPAKSGDLWISIDDRSNIHYGTGTNWISLRDPEIDRVLREFIEERERIDALEQGLIGISTITVSEDAPVSPGVGDVWIDLGRQRQAFQWNGTEWVTIRDQAILDALDLAQRAANLADEKIRLFAQDEAPNPQNLDNGDLWFDTNDGNHPYRISNGQWVSLRDGGIVTLENELSRAFRDILTAQATADGKVEFFYSATQPEGQRAGDFWIDISDGNLLRRWSGVAWDIVRDQDIQRAVDLASDASAAVDGKVTTFVQATPPAAAVSNQGDIWFDNNDGNHVYVYRAGVGWVSARDGAITSLNNEFDTVLRRIGDAEAVIDGKIDVFYGTSFAAFGQSVGDFLVDLGDGNKLKRWSGSSWALVRDTDIQAAINAAGAAANTADGKATVFYNPNPPSGADTGDMWVETDNKNRVTVWNGSAWVRPDALPQPGTNAGGPINGGPGGSGVAITLASGQEVRLSTTFTAVVSLEGGSVTGVVQASLQRTNSAGGAVTVLAGPVTIGGATGSAPIGEPIELPVGNGSFMFDDQPGPGTWRYRVAITGVTGSGFESATADGAMQLRAIVA